MPFTEEEIRSVLEKNSYYMPFTIPAGSYTHLPDDYSTACVSTVLVVNAGVPDSLVYEICKMLFDTPGRFTNVHATWGKFDIELATRPRVAPYHAGAVKYYEEKGIWDSEVDKWQKEMLQAQGLTK